MNSRRRSLLLGAAIVGLLATACGSDGGGGDSAPETAQQLMIGAAQTTFTAGTAQVAVLITGLPDDLDGSGAVDFAAGQSGVTVSLPDDLAGGGDLTVTVDGAATFLTPTGLLDAGTSVTSDATDDAQQAALDQVNQLLLLLQPDQLLAALGGIGDDATETGDNTFEGTVDLQAAADALSGADREAFLAAIAALDATTMDVEVTVDSEGRITELVAELTLNDGTTVTATVTYSAFGEPVDITIPDADGSFEESAAPAGPPDTTVPADTAFSDLDGTYEVLAPAVGPGTITVTCSSATSCTVVDQSGVTAEATRSGLVITVPPNGTCGGYLWTFTADGGVTGTGTGCIAGLPGVDTTGQRIDE